MVRRLAGFIAVLTTVAAIVPASAQASAGPTYTSGDRCAPTTTSSASMAAATAFQSTTSASSFGTLVADPASVDVSSGGTTVTIAIPAANPVNGIQKVVVDVQSPGGDPYPYTASLVAGDMYDGTWRASVPLDPSSQDGLWKPTRMHIQDTVGNWSESTTVDGGTFTVSGGAAQTVPTAPIGVSPTPGNAAVDLTWAGPWSNGGSPVAGYLVRYSDDEGVTWSEPGSATAPPVTVPGLTGEGGYSFEVAAINANGTSPWSSPGTIVSLAGPPDPPAFTTTSGDSSVTVDLGPVMSNFCPTTARALRYSADGGTTWSTAVPANTERVTVTGLTNGVAYVFEASADNVVGKGAWSSPSSPVTPVVQMRPGMPSGLTAVAGDGQVTVSWSAPQANAGPPVIGYDVSYSHDSRASWSTPTRTSTTAVMVPGLWNGTTYVFRVQAVNAVGDGDPSAQSAAVVPMASVAWTVGASATVIAGQPYTFQGRLTSHGGGLLNVPAEVWALRAGATSYVKVDNLSTGSDGVVTFEFTPKLNTHLQFRFPGQPGLRAANSPIRVVNVRPLISIAATATTFRLGTTVKIYGTFTPGDPLVTATQVTLQVQIGSAYRSVPAVAAVKRQVLPNGRVAYGYVIAYRPSARGRYNFRVLTAATAATASNGSPRLTLTVA